MAAFNLTSFNEINKHVNVVESYRKLPFFRVFVVNIAERLSGFLQAGAKNRIYFPSFSIWSRSIHRIKLR